MKSRVCPYDCFNRLQKNHRVFVQADRSGTIYEILEPTYIAEHNKHANSIWKYQGFILRDVNNHNNTFSIRNNVLGAHFDMYEFVGGLPELATVGIDYANGADTTAYAHVRFP